jgi:PAS domain S-box-containing protein
MNISRLRPLTIVAPIIFLLALEAFSIFVLIPLLGNQAAVRMLIIFAVLTVAVVPFSFWVFATIERQQRHLREASAVLDSVTDYAIFMLDGAGTVVTWSPGAERVKGYAADEILGRHVSTFYTPEEIAEGTPEHNLELAARDGRAEYEGWRVRKDGSRFWANVVSTAIRDDTGALIGFTQVARDTTQRREADEQIRSLNRELAEAVTHLEQANTQNERRSDQLAAVNAAISAISGELDLEDVLHDIVETAAGLVGARYGALGVANDRGEILRFITVGITPEERAAIGPLPQGHGLLGALITEGKPIRIPAIGADPRSHGFPPNHPPMQSLLGVPILFQGRAVGDLYLTDKLGATEFSDEDQEMVMLLANHAAVAIENARLYSALRASHDQLQGWNEELEAKVAERTREISRYSKELTTRVLRAQEEERKRIARELHDDTGQQLSTLLIHLDLLAPSIPADNPPLEAGFERVRTLAQRTLDAVRALSHDLRPTILDDFGLIAALRWFGDEYTRTFGVPVTIDINRVPEERLTPEAELALFRVAQEALTNSGKYAQATQTGVTLAGEDGAVVLTVTDNGRGFDPATTRPTRQGGLGLYGMRERVELLGGQFEIDAAPDRGTRVVAQIPLSDGDGS